MDRELYSFIESLDFLYENKYVILGDFNIGHLSKHYVDNKYFDRQIELLPNFMEFIDCTQKNYILSASQHILDLVLTRYEYSVFESTYSFVKIDTHHPPLTIEIALKNKKTKGLINNCNTMHFSFRKANFLAMYQLFQNINWNDLEDFNDVNLAVKHFLL